MSTNFYIRRTKPILCFPEFHIGKRSAGWKPLMQSCKFTEDTFCIETQRPIIESIKDLKDAVESGEWEIVNDEDVPFDLDEFIDYMANDFPIETEERKSHGNTDISCHSDKHGFEWTPVDFR